MQFALNLDDFEHSRGHRRVLCISITQHHGEDSNAVELSTVFEVNSREWLLRAMCFLISSVETLHQYQ